MRVSRIPTLRDPRFDSIQSEIFQASWLSQLLASATPELHRTFSLACGCCISYIQSAVSLFCSLPDVAAPRVDSAAPTLRRKNDFSSLNRMSSPSRGVQPICEADHISPEVSPDTTCAELMEQMPREVRAFYCGSASHHVPHEDCTDELVDLLLDVSRPGSLRYEM